MAMIPRLPLAGFGGPIFETSTRSMVACDNRGMAMVEDRTHTQGINRRGIRLAGWLDDDLRDQHWPPFINPKIVITSITSGALLTQMHSSNTIFD